MADPRDGEIVGLAQSTNGRSCTAHEICGMQATVGTLFKIRLCIIEVDGSHEEALKAVVIAKDGDVYMEFCTIGYLQRAMVTGFRERYLNKTCRIIEMYADNESPHKRRMDHRCCGTAAFEIVPDIITLAVECLLTTSSSEYRYIRIVVLMNVL